MATYIAKQTLYAGRIVQAGEEYEIELLEGQLPPPVEVAVPKEVEEPVTKGRRSKAED